jgi:hypothetical protein
MGGGYSTQILLAAPRCRSSQRDSVPLSPSIDPVCMHHTSPQRLFFFFSFFPALLSIAHRAAPMGQPQRNDSTSHTPVRLCCWQ